MEKTNCIPRCLHWIKITGRRALALLLVLAMLLPYVPAASAADSDVDIGKYSVDYMYVYSYLYRSEFDGKAAVQFSNVTVSGTPTQSNFTVYIGDYEQSDQANTEPYNNNIEVKLKALNLAAGTLNVNTVHGINSGKQVNMEVSEASKIGTLNLWDNAVLNLNVNKNLTVSTLNLGENSQLYVTVASGASFTVDSICGLKDDAQMTVVELEPEEPAEASMETTVETVSAPTDETVVETTVETVPETTAETAAETTEAPAAETEAVTEASETTEETTLPPETTDEPLPPSSASQTPEVAVSGTARNLTGAMQGDVTVNQGNGQFIINGTASMASLTADGANIVLNDTLSVGGEVTLTNTQLSGSGSLISGGTVTVSGGSVNGLTYFGFPSGAAERRLVTTNNPTFLNVATIGVPKEAGAVVTVAGTYTVSGTTVLYRDDPLTYRDDKGNPLLKSPQYYRVEEKENNTHKVVGTLSNYVFSTSLELPTYDVAGYDFLGWLIGEAEPPVKSLSEDTPAGGLILTAKTDAHAVTVHTDLGYLPDEYTNDPDENGTRPTQISTHNTHVGEKIDIKPHFRLGYEFAGWLNLKTNTVIPPDSEYYVAYSDLDDTGALNLLAQWKPMTFNFILDFAPSIPSWNDIEISYDGTDWQKLTGSELKFTGIRYDESFTDYFQRTNLAVPQLRDTRDHGEKLDFSHWVTTAGKRVEATQKFAYSAEGVLPGPNADQTLEFYENAIQASDFRISPTWRTKDYTLTLTGETPSNWYILVDGAEASFTNGPLSIDANSVVTLRAAHANAGEYSLWGIYNGNNTPGDPADDKRIYPTEKVTDAWVEYTFTMPSADVTASFGGNTGADGEPFYFDLSKSPITFAEGVTRDGSDPLSRNGFWYNHLVSDYTPALAELNDGSYVNFDGTQTQVKNYFYAWDSADPFYVTSKDAETGVVMETENQLTVINAMTVYLKDCNLVATDEYIADFEGRQWKDKELEKGSGLNTYQVLNNQPMAQYANIVVNKASNSKYAVKLMIQGENTVHCIAPDVSRTTTDYNSDFSVTGTDSAQDKLFLGTLLGNFNPKFSKLTLEEITDSDSIYLVYTNARNEGVAPITFSNCIVNAPNKRLVSVYSSTTMTNTEAVVGGTFNGASYFSCYGTTDLTVTGSMYFNQYNIRLYGQSSAVVHGSIGILNQRLNVGSVIETTGHLIVKGNLFHAGYFQLISGTVIANAVSVGHGMTVTGGTLITNVLTNSIGLVKKDQEGQDYYTANPNTSMYNGDGLPFRTTVDTNAIDSVYSVSGGKIYLLGSYSTVTYSGSLRKFDTSRTADDNRVGAIITEFLGTGSLSGMNLPEIVAEEAANFADGAPECVVVGYSNYNANTSTDARIRSVSVSGTGELYAAGNLTFFNDTTISGGTVLAHGTLRSKRDLTISGGTVTADSIGNYNQWDLKYTLPDGSRRWQATTISGGTVSTDKLGSSDTADKTTLILTGGTVKHTDGSSPITVEQDVLISYIRDTVEEASIRISGQRSGTAFTNMTVSEELTFPVEENCVWKLGSLGGAAVTKVSTAGLLDDSAETQAAGLSQLLLYQVQDGYQLTVMALDHGAQYQNSALTLNQTLDGLAAGSEVKLTLSPEAQGKTVVWYQDAMGNLYNALDSQPVGTELTFTMPYSNVELWITDELTLDLYDYPITLTADGFMAEAAKTRETSVFAYQGHIRIEQSTTSLTQATSNSTTNQIRITGELEGRNITLGQLNQYINEDYGILISDGVDAALIVDSQDGSANASVNTSAIHVPANASLTLTGKNGTADTIWFKPYGNRDQGRANYIYNKDGKLGAVTLKDIRIKTYGDSYERALIKSYTVTDNPVVFDNVVFSTNWAIYSYAYITVGVKNVTIKNCDWTIAAVVDWSTGPFYNCKTMEIIDSSVAYINKGSTYGGPEFIYYDSGRPHLILNNSTLQFSYKHSTDTTLYKEFILSRMLDCTLINNASLIADTRLELASLDVQDGSVSVTGVGSCSGYLLCNDITVAKGSVTADYIIVSAFTRTSTRGRDFTYENFLTWASQASSADRIETGTLTQTGGSITASKFIGGAYGATLNLSGGTLTSAGVGTYPAIFGYASVIPPKDEEPVYQYAVAPHKAKSTVNISGTAEVTITDGGYLGGHNSTVRIEGGEVDLAAGATLGLSDAQLAEAQRDVLSTFHNEAYADYITGTLTVSGGAVVEGDTASIHRPYGTVTVSGAATKVKVENLTALEGEITLSDAATGYDQPVNQTGEQVGVYVHDKLAARSISIREDASVYALSAVADIPSGQGGLRISPEDGDAARLYTSVYGVTGAAARDDDLVVVTSGSEQNIFSTSRIIPIRYVLNGTPEDPVTENDNPSQFNRGELVNGSDQIGLNDPVRYGYDFLGWYEQEDFSGDKIPSVNVYKEKPVTLYAKWAPKVVTFQLFIDTAYEATNRLDKTRDFDGVAGTWDANGTVFTYEAQSGVSFRSELLTAEGIYLNSYPLPAWDVGTLQILDARFRNGEPTLITSGQKLEKELLDAHLQDPDSPIKVRVSTVNPRKPLVIFHLNQKDGYPKEAKFPNTGSKTVEKYVEYGTTLSTQAQETTPTAPGYTFLGWSKTSDGPADPSILTTALKQEDGIRLNFYAVWEPKEYEVIFNATGGKVSEADEPGESDNETKTYKVKYDDSIARVPKGFKDGFVFEGWYIGAVKIEEGMILNKENFPALIEENGLKIEAKFREAKVTYHLNGGKMAGQIRTETAEKYHGYPAALMGFVQKAETSTDYDLLSEKTIDDIAYGIYSTTASYFSTNKTYVNGDYRSQLSRMGYTFQGWYTSEEEANAQTGAALEVCAPRYTDLEVWAGWSANTYDLKLYSQCKGMTYQGASFEPAAVQEVPVPNVTVGNQLPESGWPERGTANTWYAYYGDPDTQSDSSRRFQLGFTFAPLDPGARIAEPADEAQQKAKEAYEKYAAEVTQLYNAKTLFNAKDTFFLPDSYDFGGVHSVPDYPDGSEISLYAVYRERSLVFIEAYRKADGTEVRQEVAAYPYQEYHEEFIQAYKDGTYGNLKELESQGYGLVGWYLFGGDVDYETLAADTYKAKLEEWVQAANDMKRYDIQVESKFAAQATETERSPHLVSNGSSTSTTVMDQKDYTIPGSMQNGTLSYEIKNNNGLKLVSVEEMQNNAYALTFGNGNTSDNTAAIAVTLLNENNEPLEASVALENTEADTAVTLPGKTMAPGYKLRFQLYASNVITEETTYTFDLRLKYNDAGLEDQWILLKGMSVTLKPSKYDVIYDAKLPEGCTVTEYYDYVKTTQLYTKENVNYGSGLTGVLPEVEGYDNVNRWYQTDENGKRLSESAAPGDPLKFPVSADSKGKIYAETDWKIKEYTVNVADEVLTHWNVTYTPMDGTATELKQGANTVPYHSTIKFESKDSDPEEFVSIDGTTLDIKGKEFILGAANMNIDYSTERTLYLKNGSISITENGYTQGTNSQVSWPAPGTYVIQYDENDAPTATENTLTLSGTLSDRVKLGNLNITGQDSIKLNNATVTLTGGPVTAKNILVPNGSSLTASGMTLTLTPDTTRAAIGGSTSSGSITLRDVTLDMTLPAGSSASGIGPGNQTASGGDIQLTNCTVTATQKATASSYYQGSWIGNAQVGEVTLSGTTVKQGVSSENHAYSYALQAKKVALENGSKLEDVSASVHAGVELCITGSTVSQKINTNLAAGAPLSSGGEIVVENSDVLVENNGGVWKDYQGTLKIQDAASTVVINETMYLEMQNGQVTIGSNGVQQDGRTKTFSGAYCLLEECWTGVNAAPIIINGECGTITLRAPAGQAFQQKSITVNADAKLELYKGNALTVDTIAIAKDKTLDVTANGGEVKLTSFGANTEGTYTQTGGKLTTDNTIGNEVMDITLTGVEVTAKDLIAKDLSLTRGKVTCTGGNVGSYGLANGVTTVTLDGVTVNADKVGALGDHNDTFTFVELANSPTVNGTLVRDWYRIDYEVNDGVTAPNYTVFRTEQEVGEEETPTQGAIPAAPQNMPDFDVWYFERKNGNAYALSTEVNVPGYAGSAVLSSGLLTDAADAFTEQSGAKLLTLKAGSKFSGTAIVAEGRLFKEFTRPAGEDGTTITTDANGAVTGMLKIEGVAEDGGKYQLVFTAPLPAGTKLTLTAFVNDNVEPQYYYGIADGSKDSLDLSADFSAMGGGSGYSPLTNGSLNKETLLLALDFPDGSKTDSSNGVTLQYVNENRNLTLDLVSFSYTLNAITPASLTVGGGSLTVSAPIGGLYAGENLALVADFGDNAELPYDVSAKLTDGTNSEIPGKAIGGRYLVFPIGQNADTFGYEIENLYGDHSITWKLVLQEDGVNVLGTTLAAATAVNYNGGTKTTPSLKVTVNTDARVLRNDQENTIILTCTPRDTSVTVDVKRQDSGLADFVKNGVDVTVYRNGTVRVVFPKGTEGVYQICVSMDANSDNDNVYFTFVITD